MQAYVSKILNLQPQNHLSMYTRATCTADATDPYKL